MRDIVVLQEERSGGSGHHVSARFGADGELIFSGQDLGSANSIMGYREYEWTITVAASDIPKLMTALHMWSCWGTRTWRNSRLLTAVGRRFAGPKASDIEPFLRARGIPFSLWNRIGD